MAMPTACALVRPVDPEELLEEVVAVETDEEVDVGLCGRPGEDPVAVPTFVLVAAVSGCDVAWDCAEAVLDELSGVVAGGLSTE